MKKLFISVPMKGRTEENIRKSMEKMHRIAEVVWEQELEVIPSYIEDKPPKNSRQAIWYLSKSIQMMAEADYFIGIEYSNYNGCNTEKRIALEYEIPFYVCPLCIVAPDAYEQELKNCCSEVCK